MFNFEVAEYRVRNGILVPYVYLDGQLKEVAWAPLPGSQTAFLRSPEFEVLFEGTRGGCGKTLSLLMDFCQFVGIGMGPEHRGVLLRRSYPQLDEVLMLARIWIPKFFPDARYNSNEHVWTFPDGATLKFSFLEFPEQFEQAYQGKSYTWVGLEELANWPDCECLKLMSSCLRSSHPLAKLHLRATCNTYGIGADAIKERYRLPLQPYDRTVGPVILDAVDDNGRPEPPRRVIHGHIRENLPLMFNDPDYLARTLASTSNKAKAEAWATGKWTDDPDSVFHDIEWQHVVVSSFEVPNPERIRLAYDFGDSAPFSFLFFYESNGEDIELPDGTAHHAPAGSLYIVDEIFGGNKNKGLGLTIAEQAARVKARIDEHGWDPRILKRSGNVADSSIFDERAQLNDRSSYAKDFERAGIVFEPADKGPGSRIQGLGQARKMFRACKPPREHPGLFVFDRCYQWLNHVPKLQRSPKDPEDVNTEGIDHDWDATRYFLRRIKPRPLRTGRIDQLYPNARGRMYIR